MGWAEEEGWGVERWEAGTHWRYSGMRGSKELKDCRRVKKLTGHTQSILDAPFIDFRVWRKTGAQLWGR